MPLVGLPTYVAAHPLPLQPRRGVGAGKGTFGDVGMPLVGIRRRQSTKSVAHRRFLLYNIRNDILIYAVFQAVKSCMDGGNEYDYYYYPSGETG